MITIEKSQLKNILKNDLSITTEDPDIIRIETLTNDLITIKKIEKYMKQQKIKQIDQEIYKVWNNEKSTHNKEISKNE